VARETIQAAAAEAGREIEDDHFGLSLAVATGPNGEVPASLIESAQRRRPGIDPATLFATGWADARDKIEQYVDAGLSKFVVRPADGVTSASGLDDFLDHFVTEMMPLQN
jgi:hypothetical protein